MKCDGRTKMTGSVQHSSHVHIKPESMMFCILIAMIPLSRAYFISSLGVIPSDFTTQHTRRYLNSLSFRHSSDEFETHATGEIPDESSDFQSRMRNLIKKQQSTRRSCIKSRTAGTWRPDNLKTAETLEDYVHVIEEGRKSHRMIVVKFHATWCKKCHSLRSTFEKMAISNPGIIFLDVPVTEFNSNLHQGLGIESVPYGHVYHPIRGLVGEAKLSRDTIRDFAGLLTKNVSS